MASKQSTSKGKKNAKVTQSSAPAEPPAFVKPSKQIKIKPTDETKSPEKTIQLPAWMSDLPASKDESDPGFCMSLWQPWASLMICGAKRLEGRVWNSDFRGRLWIHAASKTLAPEEIANCEEEYMHLKSQGVEFPKQYPISALLGCVDVIDVISHEELVQRREVYSDLISNHGVQAAPHVDYYIQEGNESPFLFVCLRPKMLTIPLEMSGQHKIYKLPSNIHQAALAQFSISQT